MRFTLILLGIVALGVAFISFVVMIVAPPLWAMWLVLFGSALSSALLFFWAEHVLAGLDKTNELLAQLVAQSGNTEAATSADAVPTAEPVAEDDISSADGFTADD